MAKILNIETSTEVCSVSLSIDGNVGENYLKLYIPDNKEKPKMVHSSQLSIFVDEILNRTNEKIIPDAVAISSGPGSYTGLRIGVSLAKGICFAANIPLISVDTLLLLAEMAKNYSKIDCERFVPMIDARRMEVYTAVFDKDLNKISETKSLIISQNSFEEFKNHKTLFCGNGINKLKDFLNSENFIILNNIYPSAQCMGRISEQLFAKKQFVDLVYFEPFYLKDFIATTPKRVF
jgi:tRNA threonylcarbamoyladenosine biosynthesis protein TsaB